MERRVCAPRADWRKKLEESGFLFADMDGAPYWTEGAYYAFNADQIDELEDAANTLHGMCLNVVERVIGDKLYNQLAIPEHIAPYIEKTWQRQDPTVYGRFDFIYDGKTPPKLLEYNADTPTSLFETSIVQWQWLQSRREVTDQFNSVDEALVAQWRNIAATVTMPKPFYFTGVTSSLEDAATLDYLMDTARRAGIESDHIGIDEIGWNGVNFTDKAERPIRAFFKLYPWEWMAREDFGSYVREDYVGVIEPAWKMILSNKGILPLLWDMYPDHPNLLPAARDHEAIGPAYVKKPLLSREGSGIEIFTPDFIHQDPSSPYGKEGHIYQAYHPSPVFDGYRPVMGVWVIGGKACGLGIREDRDMVTGNNSRFVPHVFTP